MAMNSCLYEAVTAHARLTQPRHDLFYRLFMFYVDLDELDALSGKLTLFSRNKFNLFSFYDRDHLPPADGNLKENVLRYLETQGNRQPIDKIMLLTFPRLLGYAFNPVSFYFCFDRQGQCQCAIAEVGNTFKEKKLYFVGTGNKLENNTFHLRTPKYFYVSPFIDLDVDFDFRLKIPDERLELHVDDFKEDKKILAASLTGKRVVLSDKTLLFFFIKYPLITLKVITMIHWNALLLYFKGIKHHPKSENLSLQREIRNQKQIIEKEDHPCPNSPASIE